MPECDIGACEGEAVVSQAIEDGQGAHIRRLCPDHRDREAYAEILDEKNLTVTQTTLDV